MRPAPIWWRLLALCLVFMLGPIALVVLFSFGSNALIGFPMGAPTFVGTAAARDTGLSRTLS